MELRFLWQLLRANWRFVLIVTAVATAAGLLTTYILPEEYEASTKILIRPEKEIAFQSTSKAMMDYPVGFNIPVESISQTFAEIMVSEAVATQVVDRLQLDTWAPKIDPRWYVRWLKRARDWVKVGAKYSWEFLRYGRVEKQDPYREAVDRVMQCLTADPVENTYIFTLMAAPSDPNVAAAIANTAAEVFIEYSRTARQGEEGSAAALVKESLASVGHDLAAARQRLDEFRERTQASSLEEQLSLKLDKLVEFEAELEEAEKDLQEVDAEIASIQEQMGKLSEEVHSSTTLEKNPVLQELESDLAEYEVELAGLRMTHTEAHPKVRSLLAKIGESKARIEAEKAQVRSSDTVILNPIYQDLDHKLLQRQSVRDSTRARSAALGKTIDRYQETVGTLAAHKSELARLALEVQVLEDSYKMFSREYEEARVAAARAISEIRILHPAVPPVYPAGPIKLYYAGGGLLTGLMLALGILLLREYVDQRIRSREDLEEALAIPVLATVPHAELPARSAAFLVEPGMEHAPLSWRLLADEPGSLGETKGNGE